MDREMFLKVRCLLFTFVVPILISAKPALAEFDGKLYPFKPKLVVVMVIDQFRADYLTRHADRFLPSLQKNGDVGGFRFLMNEGAYYPFAQYDVFQCMTGPGHAMILTGAYPYKMGIPINEWFDRTTGSEKYCVSDSESKIVGVSESKSEGISPKNLLATTVGDEMKDAGLKGQVVAMALKDRSAVLLGGHRADLAFWLDMNSFSWVSSSFYLKDKKLPPWMEAINKTLHSRKGEIYKFQPTGKSSGRSTPGDFAIKAVVGSYDSLKTPLGIELSTDAAIAAQQAMKLGQGPATDVIAVSYSTHDLLGHKLGPNALEMEEMTVAEDRSFAKLFNHLKKNIPGGLKNVMIVLTADHGMSPMTTTLQQHGIEAGTVATEELKNTMESALSKKFGEAKNQKWVLAVKSLNFYLNHELAESKKIKISEIEAEAKNSILNTRGLYSVFTRSEFEQKNLPPGSYQRQILKGYFPKRSGDVVALLQSFFVEEGEPTNHMTGYAYDRSVPLLMYGAAFKKGVYANQAEVIDLAPTLSFILGVLPPSLTDGRVLSEALISHK